MRNLLEEFHSNHGLRPPTILGVREHVFTGRFGMLLLKLKSTLVFGSVVVFLTCHLLNM